MSPLRMTYLALALWGAVHPVFSCLSWLAANGWDWRGMVGAWFAGPGTAGLAWSVTITAVALTVWVLAETLVRRNWLALMAIPATVLIGPGCGLPLYLFLRTRPVS